MILEKKQNEGFSSILGFLLTTIGFAVGVGEPLAFSICVRNQRRRAVYHHLRAGHRADRNSPFDSGDFHGLRNAENRSRRLPDSEAGNKMVRFQLSPYSGGTAGLLLYRSYLCMGSGLYLEDSDGLLFRYGCCGHRRLF